MVSEVRLLYMDDDQAILRMVGRFFEDKGFTTLLADNGEKGLELFHAHCPDIVLVDLKMPKVDGFAVLDTITRKAPDIPVIVISGEGEKADVIQALRLGAWNYHTKPIDNYKLILHSVEQALDKARLMKEVKAYHQGLEKKLGSMIENFPGFIFTCDGEERITYMNQALESYIGKDALGKLGYQAIFGQEIHCPWQPENMPATEQPSKHEIRSPKDGRWYHVIQLPVFDNDGRLQERQVILYDITERKQALLDLEEREEFLRKENIRLKSSLSERYRFGEIIGKSKAMQEVYDTIINAAATDAGVIIYGESGTGKELVAKAIHETSDRKAHKLVYVNCGAIPENLIESEFFGYKKGAFTGAAIDKHGFLDLADQGTLFLDEIGEIPLAMQVKLLRAIEGSGYTPVGGTEVRKPDIRIMAATNRDLKELVKKGLMRQDFLYRIHIIPIHLPPLRERGEDIRLLTDHFLSQYEQEKLPPFTAQVRAAFQKYTWPGNVRELQNTIHRYITLKKIDFMGLEMSEEPLDGMLDSLDFQQDRSLAAMLEELEKKILLQACEQNNWHQTRTAQALEIDRRTLYRKMKQLNITKPSSV